MKLKYYKNLDGVRAIAALMVMVFHFFQHVEPSTKLLNILTQVSVFGQTGVTLFFVLSGFLITRILLNTKETTGYFKNFYLRRALRIFPLYYLYLAITYYVVPLIANTPSGAFNQQIFYYTYLQNFAITFNWDSVGPVHFWSLAVEEHFYLFWPVVVYLFSSKNLSRVIIVIIVGALLLRIFMLNNGYGVFYFTFTRFDSLAIGALLAIAELRNLFRKGNAKKFLFLSGSISIPTIIMWTYFTGEGTIYIQIYKYLFISGIYFSIISFLLCIKIDHPLNLLLRTKFFSYTGKISYGIYVYHPLALAICSNFFDIDNLVLSFFILMMTNYLMAALSFHLFESIFLRLKKHFEYNREKPTDLVMTEND